MMQSQPLPFPKSIGIRRIAIYLEQCPLTIDHRRARRPTYGFPVAPR